MIGRLRRRDQRGFSLIELVVTVGLLLVVSGTLLAFLDSTTSVTSRTNKDTRAEEALQLALRTISEDIRSASGLTTCATGTFATCVAIDVPRSAVPTAACPLRRITYGLSGTSVVASRVDYSSSCATTTVYTNKPIVTGVTSTSVFTYYDTAQNVIDVVANPAAVPKASSVTVTLAVGYSPAAQPLTLSSVAALRNNRA